MEDFLWNSIQQSDKSSLNNLHNRYFHQMYLYASKVVPDHNGLSEELVSDCFIKLWENRKNIQIQSSIKHYLFTMLHNSIIVHYQRKRLFNESVNQDIFAPLSEKEFDDHKQYAQSVQKLPDQCRKVLELAVFESICFNVIAVKLQKARNTVKTQMSTHLSQKIILNQYHLLIKAYEHVT